MRTQPMANPSSRLRRAWASAGLLMVALVVYLSLRPEPVEPPPPGLDKYEHVLAYAVLMFWFAHLVQASRGRLHLAVALVGLGVALECLQGALGHRLFAVADMAANGLGVALGWLAAPPRVPSLLHLIEARAPGGGR
jgi:VanZ family protein